MNTKLFCFPHAGGNSGMFVNWQSLLPHHIKLIPMDYPGHGKRFKETLCFDVSSLVAVLFQDIASHLKNPYCFYGHSLGTLISFELTRKIIQEKLPLPQHLILSGSGAPQFPDSYPPICHLPDAEFLEQVQKRYHGFSEEILEEKELLKILLPIIRSDFSLSESYVYTAGAPLPCPITTIAGVDDDLIKPEEMTGWQDLTTGSFKNYWIPGDHFTLIHQPKNLLAIIQQCVEDSL